MFLLGALAPAAPALGLNLQLNAAAILPESAVLVALLACLLVDLAGEKAASRWVPPFCYAGLGSALVLLALQWNNAALEPSFLGAFLADNLAIAFRAVVAASTLISLLLSWRYVERSGTPVGEYAAILLAATLGGMFLCGATDLVSIFIALETLSVASYLLSGYMKRDARSSEAALAALRPQRRQYEPGGHRPGPAQQLHPRGRSVAGVCAGHRGLQDRCCAVPPVDPGCV